MKKICLIILVFYNLCNAQLDVYFPLRTMHLDNEKRGNYIQGEGGNVGVVLDFTEQKINYSIGYVINSFGDASLLGSVGYSFELGKIKSVISLGLSNGYKYLYKNNMNALELGDFFERNGILPLALCSVKLPVYKNMGVQLNLSPVYLNYGVYFDIDRK